MTVFEAYITNLGKYAEGQLVGETLKFPTTTEEVQSSAWMVCGMRNFLSPPLTAM